MESDSAMASYVRDGKVKLIGGDGLVREDVQQAWDATKSNGEVDVVYFGIVLYHTRFCSDTGRSHNSVLGNNTIYRPILDYSATRPKLIAITSNGLDKRTHALLPLPLKPVYKYALRTAHEDKIGLEKNVRNAAGWNEGRRWLVRRTELGHCTPGHVHRWRMFGNQNADAYRLERVNRAWTVSRRTSLIS
ncbi:hypothetical protein RHS01_06763 [Rhizoctonia solani]|uniref:Uncharacterized protein n=1 Tax=Rhizoctonia solani TaxID=456999 RepID=A0A8H7M496_9AGAM|nr:hypothetical protein RHS01_06763 [Rhizoctonia solani]